MTALQPYLRAKAFALAGALLLTTGCGFTGGATGAETPNASAVSATSAASGPSNPAPPPPPSTVPAPPPSATPVPAGWPELVKDIKTGVARIGVASCNGAGVGSGFLVDNTHVATAAHVVEGAAGITIGVNGQVVTATIVGISEAEDLALLKTDSPVMGHLFAFADQDPPEGTEVGVLGYPLGENFTFDTGRINGLNRQNGPVFNGVGHILQTNTVINGGNSGGPLVTADGDVVGLVMSTRTGIIHNGTVYEAAIEGTNYVNSGAFAKTLVNAWRKSPSPVPLESCTAVALPTDNQISVTVDTPDERGMQVAQSLLLHAQAINGGAYELAFNGFTPEGQQKQKAVELWSADMNTSYWHSLQISDITNKTNGTIAANVSFTTTQSADKGPNRQTCSIWHMQYTMVWSSVLWKISEAKATMPTDPCPSGP